MADVTMCLNKDCKLKYSCYRFMAKANIYRQSYSNFKPNKDNKCEYFWNYKDN